MTTILNSYVERFRSRQALRADDTELLLDAMISESNESILADLFRAWNDKGIDESDIYSIARIMRERCTKIKTDHATFVDIVGTGGSRSKTFNVSTAAAFVVAGSGVPVAKHGNRAATSNTGSADVLSALGIEPAVDAATAERCLNEIGICFMFAPNFHRLSPTLAKVRRGLGFPTIFNCIGPLCNPAGAPHQLIGVWSKDLLPKMASALARLGTTRSWIVHASDGLDEISLSGPTYVAEVSEGAVQEFEIGAEDFGLGPTSCENVRAESAADSAALIRRILNNEVNGSSAKDLVSVNAAAAIYLAGGAGDLKGGAMAASVSIRDGAAVRKLNELARAVTR